jgi:hypothetical protein
MMADVASTMGELTDSRDRVVDISERGLHLFDLDQLPWGPPRARPGGPARSEAELKRQAEAASGVEEKWLVYPEAGSDRFPISIVRFPPNFVFPKHWHTDGEFIMILKGTAVFGGQEIGPGAMAYNDARTIYGAEAAGPDGCEFLMIRRAFAVTTIVE